MSEKNIYQKMIEIRSSIEMKKDGKGYGYNYYQLEDILNQYKPMAKELQVIDVFNMEYNDTSNKYHCNLKFINAEKPEDYYYVCIDLPLAVVKGASEAQQVGSTRTYAYRYMLMTALGVAENDDPDSQQPEKSEIKSEKPVKKMSKKDREKAEKMMQDEIEKNKLRKEVTRFAKTATDAQKYSMKQIADGVDRDHLSLEQWEKMRNIFTLSADMEEEK